MNKNRTRNDASPSQSDNNQSAPRRGQPSSTPADSKSSDRLEKESADGHRPPSPKDEKKPSSPDGYLTRSRFIPVLTHQTIRSHWPKLPDRATPIIDLIVQQPYEFDMGTSESRRLARHRSIVLLLDLTRLIDQNGLASYASLTRNAIGRSEKDYDQISYMMDSIVFDQMTMIASREALIRPWNPSLLNRTSSKGSYPYPSVGMARRLLNDIVTFHGTSRAAAISIITNRQFCLPGDKLLDGTVLRIPKEHIPDQLFIFTSPTIAYSSSPVYSPSYSFCSSYDDKTYEAQIVLQCRQKPNSFRVQGETIGLGERQVCPFISNETMEYFTDIRSSLVAYGLLIRVREKAA